jgi:Ca-activated chloride channel family protein
MSDLRFASPDLLWLLLGLPVLALWLWRAQHNHSIPSLSISSLSALSAAKPSWRLRLRSIPHVLRLGAIALLVVAAARPQQERTTEVVESEGIDIAIALDVSGSMVDGRLSRRSSLEVAKEVGASFVRGLGEDRTGLVVFQGESRIMSPLTSDHDAMAQMIEAVQNGLLPEGTAIGLALSQALNLVRESPSVSRAVVLLTDGENNQGEIEPLEAARLAQALKIRVYPIGIINTPSGISGGSSSVDEEAMKQIAELTEGQYYRATDADILANIYNEIALLEKSRLSQESFTSYNELAAFLLAPAFGLILLEVAAVNTFWRRIP